MTNKQKVKAEERPENAAPSLEPNLTLDMGVLLRRVLEGRPAEPDEAILRRVLAEGLEKLSGQAQAAEGQVDRLQQVLDLQEMTFTICALLMLLEVKRPTVTEKTGTKVAIVARNEQIGIQIWTREDGSDARFRSLSDLEETVLYQHFQKKIVRS
jgi:hypothetical protein